METWCLILVSISISLFLKFIFNNFLTAKKLPPGPVTFPIIGNLLWLRLSFHNLEPILRSLHAKFGPMVTLRIGTRPVIFIADRALAHRALIHNGAVYADRPPALATAKITTGNQLNISSSSYGPTWRLLRRNLMAEILHPSRVKSYSHARNWVLQILQNRFESEAKSGRPVRVMEHFQYAMFCLLVLMCFGDKLDESQIERIEEVLRHVLVNFGTINFMVAEMGRDPKVWEDPMAFKPERFLNGGGETFDITGSREIKMMPFGAGRRICPGYGLAMLHLEYFVANLIWKFEWKAVDGDDVDLSEKEEFTTDGERSLGMEVMYGAEVF
ncbi:hypothetical protein D5086_021701 [Populus alba]|uniref:Uncharacterized protein n=1 Tax=Populus alba TaxID=43335 RepID=A0ACC4BCY0_POPAL